MSNIQNSNNLIGVSNDMHFALLNASRGNVKAQEQTQTKKVKPAAQVAGSTPSNQPNTSTNGSPPSTDNNQSNNAADTSTTTSGDSTAPTVPKYITTLENATVETMNFVLIMMGFMLLLGMAPQTQQLNDIANITGEAQRITNQMTSIMGFFSTLENAAGTGGLTSNYFSGSNLEQLEQACQDMANIFAGNPNNKPLSDYGVYYQGVVYVPEVTYDGTYSIKWVNVQDDGGAGNPASDLQVLMCYMFQYEADVHFNPKDPSSEPSAATLQSQIDQSLSALRTLEQFGMDGMNSNNSAEPSGIGIFAYMTQVGMAVNYYETGATFVTITPSKIDARLQSIHGGNTQFKSYMTNFESQLNLWAQGYALNNDPASTNSKYQQGSSLDTWYKYLTNVQNNGSTKVQGAMSVAKKNDTNISDMQQILQSSIKQYFQSMNTVVSNFKSQ